MQTLAVGDMRQIAGMFHKKSIVKKSDSKRSKRTEERKRYVVPQKKEERKVVKHCLDKRNYIYYINIEIFFERLVPCSFRLLASGISYVYIRIYINIYILYIHTHTMRRILIFFLLSMRNEGKS